jgi:hydroxymethylpyrimidine/phosphomethylpyrimidine kinase
VDRGDEAAVTAQVPVALTIAGSDSGGGAGIQADLKTFAALGVFGASAITAVTAQNTLGVRAVHALPPDVVRAQIDAVLEDFSVAAVKIGMLANVAIVAAVAAALLPLGEGDAERRMRARHAEEARLGDNSGGPSPPAPLPEGVGRFFVVYDPVLAATSGDALAGEGFAQAVIERLLPLVDCLTPNLPEAAALLGEAQAASEADMVRQGRALCRLGPAAVLMKGGHLAGCEAVDLLVTAREVRRFAAARIASLNTHGTGCTLSSAIAANVALGQPLAEAVAGAKAFVTAAIARGASAPLGHGNGPVLQSSLVAPVIASQRSSGQERAR